jgi:alkyl sulfatase BDS1-like metallo-beta-lactamase superfamily hydrolase
MSILSLQTDMEKFSTQSKEVSFEKVDKDYYFVRSFGNVGVVFTSEGIVVIDSTLSVYQAEGILGKIREVSNLPIRYLIYTHGHGDHVGGAKVFKEEGAQIIAHRNVIKRLDKYSELQRFQNLINERQFATKRTVVEYEYPDIVYDQEYVFSLGGKTFKMIHGIGETDDQSIIHIPEDDVVFTGDFIIRSFPNVGNPAKDIRYAKEWAKMMETIQGLNPKLTFPGHGPYINDARTFLEHTNAIKESMSFVHECVINGLNAGKSLEEILESTTLPDHLKESPYLKQFYGCLDFAIRGTYRRFTGWYDGNPTNLYPEKRRTVASEMKELIGDEEKILQRVRQLIQDNNHRLGLHLLDVIIESEGETLTEALTLKSTILTYLSEVDDNYMRKNIYHNAAKQLKTLAH